MQKEEKNKEACYRKRSVKSYKSTNERIEHSINILRKEEP